MLIIGFNSRPIAISAQKSSYPVFVIDFFGDQDLISTFDNVFSVLWQRPGYPLMRRLSKPAHEYMITLAEIILEEQEIEGIIFGGGLDDCYEGWMRLSKQCPILGNPPERLPFLRDRQVLYQLAEEYNLGVPRIEKAGNPEEAYEIAIEFEGSVVLRPIGGSAGIDTYLCKNKNEITKVAERILKTRAKLHVMEYIEGIPASLSLIGNGDKCRIIALNEQLIGTNAFGAPSEFIYTGNITPLAVHVEPNKISALKQLGTDMKLVGSNGIDFVIQGNQIFIMELNPRLQGSLENIERTYDINLVDLHIKACQGDLPESTPKPKQFSGKAVLYSKTSHTIKHVPSKLMKCQVVDRSLPGVLVERGDPVCTLLTSGNSREMIFSNLQECSQKMEEIKHNE